MSAGKQVHVFFFKKCDADAAQSCFVPMGLTITSTLDATKCKAPRTPR
jgi:hypothetical protein